MNGSAFLIGFLIIAAIIGAIIALSGGGGGGSSNTEVRDVGRFRLTLDKSLSETNRNQIIEGANQLSDVINSDSFFGGGDLIPVSIVKNNNIGDTTYARASKPNGNITEKYNGGKVEYNEQYMNSQSCDWPKITIHEIIHLTGFGLYNTWNDNVESGPSLNGTNYSQAHHYYICAAAANSVTTYSNIPLEYTDNPPSGHWNENVFKTEIMTPNTSCQTDNLIFSKITAGVLKDTGFQINYSSSVIQQDYDIPSS